MIGPALGTLLFIAVLLHKVPEGFTIASIMLAGGQSRRAAIGAGALLGVLTLAGAVATSFLAAHQVAYALALSAGVTIYVAASDLIPEVNREGGPALGWTVFARPQAVRARRLARLAPRRPLMLSSRLS